MKIGILNKEMIQMYKEGNYSFDLVPLSGYDDPLLSDVEGIVAGRMSNSQIDAAKNLKHIFIPFTGKNGFDIDYVKSRGIQIHTSNVHSKFVSERALALALALLGKITYYDSELKQNRWGNRNFSSRVSWNSLSNFTVGIYGYGEIGRILHSYISPFTEDVFAYSRTEKQGVKNVSSLEELFDVADIVFVCVPLTEETTSSINEKILNRNAMYVINVARGKVVDEESLYNALKDEALLGYGSDVWYQYPTREVQEIPPSKYDLTKFNVVMTPHCGGFADNSQELRFIDTLNQIQKIG